MLALAASADPRAFTRAADGRAMVGGRIMRLVVATMLNAQPSAEPLHLQIAKAWAPDHKHAADLIRRALVLLADHELNASTFTVRCAASTGLNLYDAMIAGLVALKGPKHGGAGVLASQLRQDAGRQATSRPCSRARRAGRAFRRLRPWRLQARRSARAALLDALARAGRRGKFTREIPERIAEATGEFVNIDYALAVLVHTLGLPAGNELVLFAMARTRRLDRACQRTVAAWQADPAPRALCRSGAGAQSRFHQGVTGIIRSPRSARPSSESGTVMPSAFAVFMLMTISTFVSCTTGSSPGFSPLRIRPT